MTMTAGRTEGFHALLERANRARAQAVEIHANLEHSLSRARSLDAGFGVRDAKKEQPPPFVADEAALGELRETVDGLRKRLESQGPIEQAKGIIMAQNHCNAEQAFEILRRASQRSNTKLRLLAEDLVARTSGVEVAR